MFTSLQTRLKKASRWLPVALLPFAAQAQSLNYAPAGATNVAGTFASISTTGTAITTANTDDANSAALPIGFTFNFNGTAFTQFILNTNGFIKLGATAPSSAALYYQAEATFGGDALGSAVAADVNIVAPFNVNLENGTAAGGATYQVETTGTAPNRVCTIQWTNVRDKILTNSPQYDSFSFQARLIEGNNNVEFVYGPTVAGVTGTDAFRLGAAGIKGSGAATGQTVLVNKTASGTAWSTAVFIAGPYTGSALNYRRAFAPDAGRTFRFAPTVLLNNDAAVTALYTLGKVSSSFGSPVTAQVVVSNTGSAAQTNLPVTLAVSGATTFSSTQTVATLASGASTTLTFTYPVTGTTGTNTVLASVPNTDELASNNSKTYSQAITAGNLAFVDGSQPLFATGVGIGAANGVLAARYTIAQATVVSSVTATFAGAGTAGTTYQVQLYDATGTGGTPGTAIFTSPTLTRPGATGPVTIPVPNIAVAAGDFFVAVKELNNNIGLAYQVEDPLRLATFYFQVPGSPFALVNTTALRTRLALEVGLGAVTCAPVSGLTVGTITSTSASVAFTGPSNGTTYTVTYTPTGGTATTVTPAPTASPVVLTGLTAGTTYTVSVTSNCGPGQTSTAATTTFNTAPVGPANDNCANATALPVAATCTPVNTTNTGSTASAATVPTPPCGAPGPDVWYALTVPAGGALTVTTSASTNPTGRLDDTVLQLYSGTCGTLALIPNGCNDDFGPGLYSEVALTGLTPGATIYARVFGFAGATGDFAICARTVSCLPVSALTVSSITTTGATITFTPPAGGTNYTVTYAPIGGTTTTVTPTPTGSPVVLTGLTTGTTYTVSVTTNCGAGQTSAPATVTFTTLGYCISGLGGVCGGSNVSAVTITGTSLNATALTCTTAGGQSYTAYPATGNTTATLPRGSSYQLNVTVQTGSSVTVWIDSNRNLALEPGEYTQLTANSTTATVTGTIAIPATASVGQTRMRIRTRLNGNNNGPTDACTSFGSGETKDFTINMGFGLATRNEALAAQVNLYPNPAHRAFTLDVPAGTLRAATATLHNALGQTMQTRQLSTAGSTTFDVSSLAPGIYTLTLKSGADLVVKRVVVE